MRVGEAVKPSPQPGEVLVRIMATALNPVDYKTGNQGNPHWSYPHILGLDSAGIVEEIGEHHYPGRGPCCPVRHRNKACHRQDRSDAGVTAKLTRVLPCKQGSFSA